MQIDVERTTIEDVRRTLLSDAEYKGYSPAQARCLAQRIMALVEEGMTARRARQRAYGERKPTLPAYRSLEAYPGPARPLHGDQAALRGLEFAAAE